VESYSSKLDEVGLNYENNWFWYVMRFLTRISNCMIHLGWWPLSTEHTFTVALDTAFFVLGEKDHLRQLSNIWCIVHARSHTNTFGQPSSKWDKEQMNYAFLVPTELKKAAAGLTLRQMLALHAYMLLTREIELKTPILNVDVKSWLFPPDMLSKVLSALHAKDRWKLRMLMAPTRDNTGDDTNLVSLRLAKLNLCYKPVLDTLAPGFKVKMDTPGDITFCPVRHCRWCGLTDLLEFRMCPECKDEPKYPDVNYFCSDVCEKRCLDEKHNEEHAKYLMLKLEMIDYFE
jgi:hypothetical protein